LAYPLLVYWGLSRFDVRVVAAALLALAGVRLALAKGWARQAAQSLLPAAFALVAICLGALVLDDPRWLLYYPFLINLTLLATFALTLVKPPAMIERFARLAEPDLPEAGVAYCRKVTVAWCLFFIVNGAAALATALIGDMKVWTLYNGLISYLLMAVFFVVEYILRRRVRRRHERTEADGGEGAK